MAKVKRKSQSLKKKKKKWFSIVAPSDFGSKELGEAYVFESEELIGKEIRVNMMFVAKTRNSNIRLTFKVTNTKEGVGITELVSYKMLPSYIKRIVRKRKSKLDVSHVVKTKDGKNLLIKYIVLTRGKASKGILTALGKSAKELISEEFSKKTSKKVFDDVIHYSLQRDMKKKLSKVYPTGVFEVRFLK